MTVYMAIYSRKHKTSKLIMFYVHVYLAHGSLTWPAPLYRNSALFIESYIPMSLLTSLQQETAGLLKLMFPDIKLSLCMSADTFSTVSMQF